MGLSIGTFRRRLKLQQTTETRDDYGALKNAWAEVAEVWAAIEPLRGDELLRAQQVTAEVTTRIRIRYRSGVTPKMRAQSETGTRTFDIRAVIDVRDEHKELELLCLEAAA